MPGNAQALARTAELLRQDRVTLFEAAIAHGPFLVRVDILRKDGDAIDLIEVKAKSFSSRNPHAFRAKRGGLDGGMLPYLQDVAFQRRVLELAFPGWCIRSHLMLADTEQRCSVAGLNQRFKIRRRFGEPQERPGQRRSSRHRPRQRHESRQLLLAGEHQCFFGHRIHTHRPLVLLDDPPGHYGRLRQPYFCQLYGDH